MVSVVSHLSASTGIARFIARRAQAQPIEATVGPQQAQARRDRPPAGARDERHGDRGAGRVQYENHPRVLRSTAGDVLEKVQRTSENDWHCERTSADR